MSTDPVLISGDGEPPVWVGEYTGPAEPDGHHLRIVQILSHHLGPGGRPTFQLPRRGQQLTARQAHGLADFLLTHGYGGAGREYFAELGRFVCPRCTKVSGSGSDLHHGWCGRCHDWTAPPRNDD